MKTLFITVIGITMLTCQTRADVNAAATDGPAPAQAVIAQPVYTQPMLPPVYLPPFQQPVFAPPIQPPVYSPPVFPSPMPFQPPVSAWATGLHGWCMLGPIVPMGQTEGPGFRPLSGAIISIQSAMGGREIARAVSDSSGQFIIALPPGLYRVVPLPPNPALMFPRANPFDVLISYGSFTSVMVMFDSGIR